MLRLLFLFLWANSAFAQLFFEGTGAQNWAMAHSLVAVPHTQSFFGNSAGIVAKEGLSLQSSIDSRFQIPGLNTSSLAINWTKNNWGLALGGLHFGDRQYSENSFGLALAKKLNGITLSVKVEALGSFAENYASRNTLITSFGLLAQVLPKIHIGFHARNLSNAKLSAFEPLPTILRFGLAYRPISALLFTSECQYITNGQFSFRNGLEYKIRNQFFVRSGIDFSRKTNHFGIGYAYKKWQIDYAVNTHPYLGISHHASLDFHISDL
ncbi:hypothetical protein LAG90_08435 [Marinilongibacter aquaticus]|uniref:hypothetical protein n=1 Tax=Marinilongibacter aquaticus TaxID=2975157 RepID=UPI0021BD530A|nr:hypothetical protein [Marinilongibacter aquaticus]UBM60667.1 hypothetical protein LAG90_08435 [Marinilongibacter aquaticus]